MNDRRDLVEPAAGGASEPGQPLASLERKVEELTRQGEPANLARSRFLAAASHDLRQPLHALGLFAAQLRSHITSEEGSQLIDRIDAAVTATNELFDGLLDISKLDAGVPTPTLGEFPIDRLLRRVESRFAALARGKGLSFKLVESSAWVRSDAILLERIVLNLASNAVHYTQSGGVVVGCRRRGNSLRIEVWDSGPGIPEKERRNIFGEFYRLAGGPQAGLGLGLAVVDRLGALLGHPIELVSTLGRGSRFAVTVPMAPAQARNQPSAATAAVELVRGKLVIVIDDDKLVRDSMGGLLRNWACRVIVAATAAEALAALDEGERADLIISDYHLAEGQSGITAIEQLHRACGPVPAFLMTGDTAPERLREARESGYHLLHKPIRPMALRAMMSQLLKKAGSAGATTE